MNWTNSIFSCTIPDIHCFPFHLRRKRAREEEIETAEKAKRDREWQKNFEVRSRNICMCLYWCDCIETDNEDFWVFRQSLTVPFIHLFPIRKRGMGAWTVGGTSRPKARPKRRRRIGHSLSPRKSKWSRESDVSEWDLRTPPPPHTHSIFDLYTVYTPCPPPLALSSQVVSLVVKQLSSYLSEDSVVVVPAHHEKCKFVRLIFF